jgi:hypothetical protein
MVVTLLVSMRFERNRLAPLPGQTVPTLLDNPVHFLPLYALRVAPIALGACLIFNATGYFTVTALHRRFRKSVPPVATGG